MLKKRIDVFSVKFSFSVFIVVGLLAISPIAKDFSGKVFGDPKDSLVTVWHF